MRTGRLEGLWLAVGLAVTLAVGGCAAPGSASSGSGAAADSTTTRPPLAPAPVDAQTWVAVQSPEVTSTAGSQSTIASAPGTAGLTAAPPIAAAPPVTSAPGLVVTPLPACRAASLRTITRGTITFATGATTGAPWVVGADPSTGAGYEAAVAAAVAAELGFASDHVRWVRSDLHQVAAGRTGGFDVAVGEFAVPDTTGGPVDFSTGYFSISNSVVARTGTPAAGVGTLAGLKTLRVGAAAGSVGLQGVRTRAAAATGFPSAPAALAALRSGAVDAAVLPTSLAVSAGPGLTVVGQLPDGSEQPQQFGMVLARKSPLTSCVSAAIDQLRITGGLAALLQTWIPAAAKPLH